MLQYCFFADPVVQETTITEDLTTIDETTHGHFMTLEDTTEVGTATSATGNNYSTTMEPTTP